MRIIGICAVTLAAILAWAYLGPQDWRSQGLASCMFKDASGAMQIECRRS